MLQMILILQNKYLRSGIKPAIVAFMENTIVASLEGMKITVTAGQCTLLEYNYVQNGWQDVESMPWPLSRSQAERWLDGWNTVDHFHALNKLVAPLPE